MCIGVELEACIKVLLIEPKSQHHESSKAWKELLVLCPRGMAHYFDFVEIFLTTSSICFRKSK